MEKKVERKKVARATVRRVEEPVEDIDVEIQRELQKKAIVEETVVVRKEVPVAEYETQVQRSAMEAREYRQEGRQELRQGVRQELRGSQYGQVARSSQYAAGDRLSPARVTATGSRVVSGDSILGQAIARANSPQRFSNAHVGSPVRTTLNPGRSQFDPAAGSAVDSAVRASIARQNVYGEGATSVHYGGQRMSGFNATGGTSSFMARSHVGQSNFQGGNQNFTAYQSQMSGFDGGSGERVLDAAVVSRKVAKYDPETGDIDGEVHQALDRDGRIAGAVQRDRPGSLYQKDFFE
jgi:hypothetical protein